MGASITVTRSPELRGRQGTYEVSIDGTAVGALERGQSLTHPVPAGEHSVQVTRDVQHTSPRQTVAIADDEQITLYVSFISERAAYVRSPTKASDYLILTTDGSVSNADGTMVVPRETRARGALIVLGLIALVVGFVTPSGPVKQAAFAVFFIATAVGFYLTVRHMRHLYRSFRDG